MTDREINRQLEQLELRFSKLKRQKADHKLPELVQEGQTLLKEITNLGLKAGVFDLNNIEIDHLVDSALKHIT